MEYIFLSIVLLILGGLFAVFCKETVKTKLENYFSGVVLEDGKEIEKRIYPRAYTKLSRTDWDNGTFLSNLASPVPTFAVVVVFPTPPLPDVITITSPMLHPPNILSILYQH